MRLRTLALMSVDGWTCLSSASPAGARCLEIGGGGGSIASWLCEHVGPEGHVTATDLQTGFLSELSLANLTVLSHDVRTDEFPEGSFDLIHARAVLMHIADRMAALRRKASWLAPGSWLLVEEPDFGMWLGDFDPAWAAHPGAACGFAYIGAWGTAPEAAGHEQWSRSSRGHPRSSVRRSPLRGVPDARLIVMAGGMCAGGWRECWGRPGECWSRRG